MEKERSESEEGQTGRPPPRPEVRQITCQPADRGPRIGNPGCAEKGGKNFQATAIFPPLRPTKRPLAPARAGYAAPRSGLQPPGR